MSNSTNGKSHQIAEEADEQMATLATDNRGAAEAREYVSSYGQPESDEGILLRPTCPVILADTFNRSPRTCITKAGSVTHALKPTPLTRVSI